MIQEPEIKVIEYLPSQAAQKMHIQKIVLYGPNRKLILVVLNSEKAKEICIDLQRTVKGFERIELRERIGRGDWGLSVNCEESQVVLSGPLSSGLMLLQIEDFVSRDNYWKLFEKISILNGIDFVNILDEYEEMSAERPESEEEIDSRQDDNITFKM